jgi:hypothetical protein
VRITGLNGIDLTRFEFDYDTTWQAFFLDAELNVYSRYGGRDETSSDGRLSKESLLTTMREVLEVHQRRGAATAAESNLDVHPRPRQAATPEDIPLLKAAHQGCVHCHQVQEYRLLQAFHDGRFTSRQLFGFPLLESLGIRIDRAHGHRIEEVMSDSPAAKAGLAAGDVVTRAGDVPVHSEQDLRWALHRLPEDQQPLLTVLRAGADPASARVLVAKLAPEENWRQTELGWRKSLRSVPLPLGFLGYPLGTEERRTANFPADKLAIRVVSIRKIAPLGTRGLAENLALEKGDLIVLLAGHDESRTLDEFRSDLLRRFSPGDTVTMTVLRDGRRVELQGPFPDWHTSETSVP